MIQKVLIGVVLPACIALVMFLVLWQPWRRLVQPRGRYLVAPIAFSFAFLISFIAESGIPIIENPDGWQWKLDRWEWIAPLVLVTVVCAVFASLRAGMKWYFAALACIVGVLVMKWMHLPDLDTAKLRFELGLVVVIIIALLNPVAVRRSGLLLPAVFMIIFATTSGVVMQSGFAKLAIMCGALSATCGTALLVGMFNRNFSIAHGGVIVLVVLLVVIMACGYAYDYSELNVLCFILPVLAPLTLWLGELQFVKKLPSWQATTIRISLVLIPCAITMVLVAIAGMESTANDQYGY